MVGSIAGLAPNMPVIAEIVCRSTNGATEPRNSATQTGIILHMLRDVATSGQFGVTAVADSHEKADALYQRFLDILDEEALVAKLEVLGAE